MKLIPKMSIKDLVARLLAYAPRNKKDYIVEVLQDGGVVVYTPHFVHCFLKIDNVFELQGEFYPTQFDFVELLSLKKEKLITFKSDEKGLSYESGIKSHQLYNCKNPKSVAELINAWSTMESRNIGSCFIPDFSELLKMASSVKDQFEKFMSDEQVKESAKKFDAETAWIDIKDNVMTMTSTHISNCHIRSEKPHPVANMFVNSRCEYPINFSAAELLSVGNSLQLDNAVVLTVVEIVKKDKNGDIINTERFTTIKNDVGSYVMTTYKTK